MYLGTTKNIQDKPRLTARSNNKRYTNIMDLEKMLDSRIKSNLKMDLIGMTNNCYVNEQDTTNSAGCKLESFILFHSL